MDYIQKRSKMMTVDFITQETARCFKTKVKKMNNRKTPKCENIKQ